MNFTGQYKANIQLLTFIPSDGSEWKGYVLRITILAIGFGICVLLLRRKGSFGRWRNLCRNQDRSVQTDFDDSTLTTEIKDFMSDDRIVAYNITDGEVCPICLNTPKIGVKAPCGHLLCAECLAGYCDVRIAPAPPPCPLCRAPLNSVALACDFAILGSKILDSNTIIVRDWVREYNKHRASMMSVRPLLTTRLVLFFNILTFFVIVGLIAGRLQAFAEI